MLSAIALRESGGRNIPERGSGSGMGVFQLTHRPRVAPAQAYDPPFAANYAAAMLADSRRRLARRHSRFSPQQLLQATAASYNKGLGKKSSRITDDPRSIDLKTAGGNYGQNILDLMDCFPGR